ncbi:hypothetical protein Leryth_027342 [Lithospermum erythrorhizon]|nr:hypothetical protein Leryth_027342 [Lithospermum erythrorhizon]
MCDTVVYERFIYLEIVSNGKLKSPEHRVVTNAKKSRTSIATFINPSLSCIVKPATVLIDESNPALFEPSIYKDFVNGTQAFGPLTKAFTK